MEKVESLVSMVEKVMVNRKERKAKDKVAGIVETLGTIGPVVGSQEEELQAEVQHILSREEEVEKEEEGIPEAEPTREPVDPTKEMYNNWEQLVGSTC